MSLSPAMPATNSTLSPLYLFPSRERSYFYIEMVLPISLRDSLLHIHVSVDFLNSDFLFSGNLLKDLSEITILAAVLSKFTQSPFNILVR